MIPNVQKLQCMQAQPIVVELLQIVNMRSWMSKWSRISLKKWFIEKICNCTENHKRLQAEVNYTVHLNYIPAKDHDG